jgi:hypothetical protein
MTGEDSRALLRAVYEAMVAELRPPGPPGMVWTDRRIEAAFGPFASIEPMPVEEMPNAAHPFFRPEPRGFDYPVC